MVKKIYVQNPNYRRKNLYKIIEFVANNAEAYKKTSEAVMSIYDSQPKLVRDCVKEFGIGDIRAIVKAKNVREKCNAVRNSYYRKITRTSNFIEI